MEVISNTQPKIEEQFENFNLMPKRLQLNLLKQIEKKGAKKTPSQLEAKLMRAEMIR